MKLGKHISNLLYEQDKVSVPGFGTFFTKYVPARFIPEKKIVQPPGKVARFDQNTIEKDTPLIDYMASKESVDKDQVHDFINSVVKEIRFALEKGKTVELENLGHLSKDADGNIVFEAMPDVNYLTDTAGVAPVRTPDQKKEPGAPFQPGTHDKESQKKPTEDQTPAPEEPVEDNHTAFNDDTTPDTLEDKTPTKPIEAMTETSKDKSTPDAIKWLLIIGIPLLIIILLLGIHFNVFLIKERLASTIPFFTTEEEVADHIYDEEPDDQLVVTEEDITDPETGLPEPPEDIDDDRAIEATPEPGRPVYYLVVGSFRNPEKAGTLVSQLQEEGADRARILEKTPSNYHRVYYDFYYDINEASRQKNDLRPELKEVAWILHR